MSNTFKHYHIRNFLLTKKKEIIECFINEIKNDDKFLPDNNEQIFESYKNMVNTHLSKLYFNPDDIINSTNCIELVAKKMSNVLREAENYNSNFLRRPSIYNIFKNFTLRDVNEKIENSNLVIELIFTFNSPKIEAPIAI